MQSSLTGLGGCQLKCLMLLDYLDYQLPLELLVLLENLDNRKYLKYQWRLGYLGYLDCLVLR